MIRASLDFAADHFIFVSETYGQVLQKLRAKRDGDYVELTAVMGDDGITETVAVRVDAVRCVRPQLRVRS